MEKYAIVIKPHPIQFIIDSNYLCDSVYLINYQVEIIFSSMNQLWTAESNNGILPIVQPQIPTWHVFSCIIYSLPFIYKLNIHFSKPIVRDCWQN